MVCSVNRIKKQKYCAGDLTKKITITQRTLDKANPNPLTPKYVFPTVKTLWAGVKTVSGVIYRDGISTNDGSTHVFIIRYNDNITQELFVEHGGKRYDILDVVNINEQDTWLELRCKLNGLSELRGSNA